MKTFEQHRFEYMQKIEGDLIQKETALAKHFWLACDAEWRSVADRDQPVKTFQEWKFEVFGNLMIGSGIKKAWDFQERQWRHVVANKLMALQIKGDALELLKKENEELRQKIKELTNKDQEKAS